MRYGWIAIITGLLTGFVHAAPCEGLAGDYRILWAGEAPQAMRIRVAGNSFRVELALPDGRWIAQPLGGQLTGGHNPERGMLPRCLIEMPDYGLFGTTRGLSWLLAESPGQPWVLFNGKTATPVQKTVPATEGTSNRPSN